MRIFYTLLFMLLRGSGRRSIKCKKNKVKNLKSELPTSIKKISNYMKTLKFTKSPQTIIKNFANIKEEIGKIFAYNKDINLEFDGEIINSVEDIQKLDIIQNRYIKDFINNQINIELEKEKEVNQVFLKESLIKKALSQALKVIEYIPEDVEMRLRITELEEKLLKCYEGES